MRHGLPCLLLLAVAACNEPGARPTPATPSSKAPSTPSRPAPPAPVDAAPPLPPPHYVQRGAEMMGTMVQMRLWTRDDDGARAAMSLAFDEIARIERLMTTWRDDSDISRVNAAAGDKPVEVSPETLECVKRSLEYSRLSSGAFDVSFYALKGLWKFDQDLDPKLPDPKELKARIALIDYRKIRLDEERRTIFLEKKGMRINLGGIAKGYAVDRAAAVLKKAGFGDGIVQAGGDLYLMGKKSGRPFLAGIRDPRSERDDYFAQAPVENHAFSTAGDYERTFTIKGRRYHHIIDPKTGYPADRCRSVTVWAPDATTADGLDDAIFILGPVEGMKLVESLPGVGAVIVDKDNKVLVSKALQGKIEILRPPTDGP